VKTNGPSWNSRIDPLSAHKSRAQCNCRTELRYASTHTRQSFRRLPLRVVIYGPGLSDPGFTTSFIRIPSGTRFVSRLINYSREGWGAVMQWDCLLYSPPQASNQLSRQDSRAEDFCTLFHHDPPNSSDRLR